MLRVVLAALHLLALGIGLGAVVGRSAALRSRPFARADVIRAFRADGWWAVAAVLWLATGIWRVVAGTEKATTYYMHDSLFFAKMGCFVAILLLEVWPMLTLMRWRSKARRGGSGWHPNADTASRIALIGYLEAALVVAMVALAAAMARGYGAADGAP
jgi:putative membrane protein